MSSDRSVDCVEGDVSLEELLSRLPSPPPLTVAVFESAPVTPEPSLTSTTIGG